MWIAVFNFYLFVLLIALFFYGLIKWDKLLAEPENDDVSDFEPTTTTQRIPIWILIATMTIYSLLSDIASVALN